MSHRVAHAGHLETRVDLKAALEVRWTQGPPPP